MRLRMASQPLPRLPHRQQQYQQGYNLQPDVINNHSCLSVCVRDPLLMPQGKRWYMSVCQRQAAKTQKVANPVPLLGMPQGCRRAAGRSRPQSTLLCREVAGVACTPASGLASHAERNAGKVVQQKLALSLTCWCAAGDEAICSVHQHCRQLSAQLSKFA